MPTAKLEAREARVATGAALRPERFIILAIVAAVLWRVWDFLQLIPAYLRAPYQFDYEEGNIVNALLRISHHQTPYPDPHAFPSVFNTYGPVAYYALYIPVKLFGLSFLAPRILIFSCALLIALFLALTLWRATRSRTIAAAFGAIYLCSPIVQDWCYLVRVDLLGIALTLAGLWLFLNYPDMRGLAATAFAAALLTKLSLLAAPAACIAYLLVARKRKQAALFALILVGEFAVVVSIFAVLTDGAILTHLFRSHPDPFSWTVYLLRMSALFAENRALFALSAVYIIGDLLRRRPTVPTLWLVFATFAAITAGKLGSGWNHFLEWPAALCLCAGLGLFTLTQLPARSVAFGTTTIASAWVLWFALQPNLRTDAFGPVESCSSAYAWVKNDAGPNVLSMNVGALVFGSKKVWVSNPFVLSQLVQQSGWSDQELTRMIREHRFDAILTDVDYAAIPAFRASGVELFSPAELQAIFNDYTITRRLHCKDIGVIYEPKSPAGRQ